MLTHTVLLKFTDAADAPEAKRRLEDLLGKVPTLRSLRVGLDIVRAEGSYDLALVTTHDDLDGLHEYQEHLAHVAFLDWLRPRLAGRAAVDFLDRDG